MIPGGWNSQRVVSNVRNNLGAIKVALEKKMIITGGWSSQRKANITLQDPGNVDDAMNKKKMIPGGYNRQREASKLNRILAMLKTLLRKS